VPSRQPGGADRTICVCFSVGLVAIRVAIARKGLATTAEIGYALKTGANCGSCLPEIKAILALAKPSQDAKVVASSA
jgi:assimilatory nitrate reductase catalytic subunit